jgi:hypothetical protein
MSNVGRKSIFETLLQKLTISFILQADPPLQRDVPSHFIREIPKTIHVVTIPGIQQIMYAKIH